MHQSRITAIFKLENGCLATAFLQLLFVCGSQLMQPETPGFCTLAQPANPLRTADPPRAAGRRFQPADPPLTHSAGLRLLLTHTGEPPTHPRLPLTAPAARLRLHAGQGRRSGRAGVPPIAERSGSCYVDAAAAASTAAPPSGGPRSQ